MRFGAVVALSVASVVATPAAAMASVVAHTSDATTVVVQGTISALLPATGTPTSLVLQPFNLARPTENIPLLASTVYLKAGATLNVTALATGVPVRVTMGGNPSSALTVQFLLPNPVVVSGVVTALTPASGVPTSFAMQPRDSSGAPVTVALNAATVYYWGARVTTVTSLALGAQVRVVGSGTPLTANVVYIAVPRPITVVATVSALNPTTGTPTSMSLSLVGRHRGTVTVQLSPTTTYTQGAATVSVNALSLGSLVRVTMSGSPAVASAVNIAVPRPISVSGTVTALYPASGTPTSVTVRPREEWRVPVTVALVATTRYFQLGTSASVANLLVGSRVELTASGTPLTASVVHISAPATDFTLGSVTAVVGSTLGVQPLTTGAAPMNFTLTGSTMYFSGRRVATLAAVNVGDIVLVGANASAPTLALIVTVRNMVIVGRVSALAGDVISVTGLYGTPLTVNVTSSTQFRRDGHAASLGVIRTGDVISAMGPAMSGVTQSITATTVWIGARSNDIYREAFEQHRDHTQRHHH